MAYAARMHHLAILRPAWRLAEKILSGEKTVESRWYRSRRAPWDRIQAGDTVFFKEGNRPISLAATVRAIRQEAALDPKGVTELLERYGPQLGLAAAQLPGLYERIRTARYAVFIFLENPRPTAPFYVDKAGFGAMSAWITVEDIARIRRISPERTPPGQTLRNMLL